MAVVRDRLLGLVIHAAAYGLPGPLSVGGFPVGVAVCGAFEYLRGRPDLRFGWLQDRIPGTPGPGRERLAQIAEAGIRGGDGQALPVGQPPGERAVRGKIGDQLAYLAALLVRDDNRFAGWGAVAGSGSGSGSGSAERSGGNG
jgi:hypothetical protein